MKPSMARTLQVVTEQAHKDERKRLALEAHENVWYCEKCDRWQDRRSGCEADIRHDQRERDAELAEAVGCACLVLAIGTQDAPAVIAKFSGQIRLMPKPATVIVHDERCPCARAAAIRESTS